jgi:hypothetical protein
VDPEAVLPASARAIDLILEVAGVPSLILTGQRSRAMVFVVHIKKFDITEIIGHNPILYDSIPNPLRNAIDLRATFDNEVIRGSECR